MKKFDTKWVKYIGGAAGGMIAGIVLMFGGVKVVYPAVSQLVGLAVAESATLWNNVRDASAGDNITNGILDQALMLFDGTNFDRARGDITNGLDVDVTRLPGGGQTPADAFANPTTFLGTWSLSGVFNGTTWDRWRGQVSSVQSGTLLNGQTVSAVNTPLTVVLTGVASTQVHLYRISRATCTPAGVATLQVNDGASVIWGNNIGVPAFPGAVSETWPTGLTGTTGASISIVIGSCGAGNQAVIEVQADRF